MTLALALAAFIVALVSLIADRGKNLLAWAVLLLAAIYVLPLL